MCLCFLKAHPKVGESVKIALLFSLEHNAELFYLSMLFFYGSSYIPCFRLVINQNKVITHCITALILKRLKGKKPDVVS